MVVKSVVGACQAWGLDGCTQAFPARLHALRTALQHGSRCRLTRDVSTMPSARASRPSASGTLSSCGRPAPPWPYTLGRSPTARAARLQWKARFRPRSAAWAAACRCTSPSWTSIGKLGDDGAGACCPAPGGGPHKSSRLFGLCCRQGLCTSWAALGSMRPINHTSSGAAAFAPLSGHQPGHRAANGELNRRLEPGFCAVRVSAQLGGAAA